MGLRATIHQSYQEAIIALGGELKTTNFAQIHAIVKHLHGRGCRKFIVDLTALAPMSLTTQRRLQSAFGQLPAPVGQVPEYRAVRLLADYPTARPQPGCRGQI